MTSGLRLNRQGLPARLEKIQGMITPAPAPVIDAVSPAVGVQAGATLVTITGHDFVTGCGVEFGATPAAAVQFISSTEVRATSPAGAEGAVDVTLTNPDSQSDTLADGFAYAPDQPVLRKASIWSDSVGNLDSAIRDGTNFLPTIGGAPESRIVTAAELGLIKWPTPNCFEIRAAASGFWNTKVCQWDLGVPIVGTRRRFRFYFQVGVPNTVTPDGVIGNYEHGIEMAAGEFGGGTGFAMPRIPKINGTFFYGFAEVTTGTRYYLNNFFWQKDTTYRAEIDQTFVVGGYTARVYFYDEDGVLVADSADPLLGRDDFLYYTGPNGSSPILHGHTFLIANFANHRYFRIGTNGPNSNYPLTNVQLNDPMYRYGAPAVSEQGLCGPYIPGEVGIG